MSPCTYGCKNGNVDDRSISHTGNVRQFDGSHVYHWVEECLCRWLDHGEKISRALGGLKPRVLTRSRRALVEQQVERGQLRSKIYLQKLNRTRSTRTYTPCSILPWTEPGKYRPVSFARFKSQALTSGDG